MANPRRPQAVPCLAILLLITLLGCNSATISYSAGIPQLAAQHRLLLAEPAGGIPGSSSIAPTTTTAAASSSGARIEPVWVWDWRSGLALLLATIN
jgi:hypothetical protein